MEQKIEEKKIINHDLKELSKYSSMLSKTVHDINNPLAVFIGQISIMEMLMTKDKLTEDRIEKIIEKFKSATETFKARIENLRAFYKVPLDDVNYSKLDNIIESTIYFYENQLYKNDIHYDVKIEKHIEFAIPGPHLFLCVKHILQNAIEALEDVPEPKIKIEANKINEILTIKISDNGPGLKIDFDKACEFGFSTKGDENQGFGLSIVQALAHEDNFEIFYNYEDGAVFTINILDK